MWTYSPVPFDDRAALAPFVFRHRASCLHADQGESVEAHAAELAALPADEAFFIAAVAGGVVEGCIGVELDPVAGRAWLRGPLVGDALPAAAAAALRSGLLETLLEALLEALPGVRRFDAFPAADAAALIAADEAAGFRLRAHCRVMRLTGPWPQREPATPATPTIVAATADHPGMPRVTALHDALFPNTYLPGAAMASSLDADHALFVAETGAGPADYVYVQGQLPADAGYVDYLGVDAAARGRGIGAALLAMAVDWALRRRGLPHVDLTVDRSRTPALGLYRNAGFRTLSEGLHLVLER